MITYYGNIVKLDFKCGCLFLVSFDLTKHLKMLLSLIVSAVTRVHVCQSGCECLSVLKRGGLGAVKSKLN